jgi:hypothetical protein
MADERIKVRACPLCTYEHEYRVAVVRVPIVALVAPDPDRKQEFRVAAVCPNRPPDTNGFAITLGVAPGGNFLITEVTLNLLTPPRKME